ncbi:MAG: MoaD/ThiS family protein [Deltaproteobacteria bacterium]|nr:MoaD/ThiS family protein [Deltaproteobacteria bacterium]
MPLEFDGKKMDIEKPLRIRQLLKKLSLNPEDYIVVVNDTLVTDDEIVKNEDNVKIIRVVSGG